jgi:hypothetical protein
MLFPCSADYVFVYLWLARVRLPRMCLPRINIIPGLCLKFELTLRH